MPLLKPETQIFRENLTTKTSTSLHTHSMPVDTTLTTPGTAQDIWLPDSVPASINIVTNPSCETGDPPTGYTAIGSTLARSITVAYKGTYSLMITPDNVVAGEGAYWNLGTFGAGAEKERQLPISISAYLQKNAAAGTEIAKVRLYGSSSGFVANGNAITLSAAWQRSYITYTIQTTETWYLYIVNTVQFATAFYADAIQAEFLPETTEYLDGDQGRKYSWDGPLMPVLPRRKFGLVQVRDVTLHTTRDVYVDYDGVADTSSFFKRAGTDWGDTHPRLLTKRISMLNVLPGEQPRVYGEVHGNDSFA